MAITKLRFPPHEGLPDLIDYTQWGKSPDIDGYIEPDPGATTHQLETGWTRASRVTYASDTGLPQMVFQGLKHNSKDYLLLSFMVRFDTAFTLEDRIILLLHPQSSSIASSTPTAGHRRVDITPMDVNGAGTAGDAADPNDVLTPEGFRVRTNREAKNVQCYSWDTGSSSWLPISVNNLAKQNVKVRSWEPDAAGLGANRNWSVEVAIPMTKGEGGASWIDLTTSFAFYFVVIRTCSKAVNIGCVTTLDESFSTQYAWPRANYLTGRGLVKDPASGPIGLSQHFSGTAEAGWPTWLGEGVTGGGATAYGVHFKDGTGGIGVRVPANPSGPLSSTIDGAATITNTFVARIVNDVPVTEPAADAITAEFRLAAWGLGPGDFERWGKIPRNIHEIPPAPLGNPNPTAPAAALAPGATTELTMDWGLSAADRTAWGPHGSDQCLWVKLDSHADVVFSEASVRRNMSFVNLSSHDDEARISGEWEPPPPSGVHDFLFLVSHRRIDSTTYDRPSMKLDGVEGNDGPHVDATGRGPGMPFKEDENRTLTFVERDMLPYLASGSDLEPHHVWLVINNAYRATESTLTLSGRSYRVFQPAGGFAYVAAHEGPVAAFKYEVTGDAGFTRITEDAYSVSAPHGGSIVIRTHLETVPPRDQSPFDDELSLIEEIDASLHRLRGCQARISPLAKIFRQILAVLRRLAWLRDTAGATDGSIHALLEHMTVLEQSAGVLDRLEARLGNLEHVLRVLDRVCDQLYVAQAAGLDALLVQVAGNDAPAASYRVRVFLVKAWRSAGIAGGILSEMKKTLSQQLVRCESVHALEVVVRRILRLLDKLGTFTAPLEKKLPWLDKLLPGGSDPGVIVKLLEPLAGHVDTFAQLVGGARQIESELLRAQYALTQAEAIQDDEIEVLAQKLFDAAKAL